MKKQIHLFNEDKIKVLNSVLESLEETAYLPIFYDLAHTGEETKLYSLISELGYKKRGWRSILGPSYLFYPGFGHIISPSKWFNEKKMKGSCNPLEIDVNKFLRILKRERINLKMIDMKWDNVAASLCGRVDINEYMMSKLDLSYASYNPGWILAATKIKERSKEYNIRIYDLSDKKHN